MWVFLQDAFISVEEHETEPRIYIVKARIRGDIERLFPEADVAETLEADYRFATSLPRERVSQVISLRASKVTYPAFIETMGDADRRQAYIEVWGAMYEEQNRRYGPAPKPVDEVVEERPRYVLEDPRYELDNLDEEPVVAAEAG